MQPLLPPHRRAECIDSPFCIILELFAIKGAAVLRQPPKKQPECRFLVIRLLFYLYKKSAYSFEYADFVLASTYLPGQLPAEYFQRKRA